MPSNPAKISKLRSSDSEHPDIVIAKILYDLLKKNGWDVTMLDGGWLKVEENDYYLLPLLDGICEEGEYVSVRTTVQIHHLSLLPEGIFEYQYSQKFDNLPDAIKDAFKSWVILDWQTLVDVANPKNPKHMSQVFEINYDKEGLVKRHLFYGNLAYYPSFDVEEAKAKGMDVDPYIDEFCPCCLFTRSMEAFDKQIKDTSKNYAIRLFAMKNPDGELDADCRINGEECPEAEEYLKKYANTWKDCDLIKFRKQYVVISSSF